MTKNGIAYDGDSVIEARRMFERVTGVQIARLPKDARKARIKAALYVDGDVVAST